MKLESKCKRLAIFLFYDKDGIVDSYIPYMLSDIKKNVDNIFVVANGKINDEGKKKLKGIADTIFERKNVGFDVWGYKEALEKIGWEELYKYDEVILMNYTIMGPIYPFKEMFDTMAKKDLDFWGITKYHKVDFDPFGIIECGYIPEHLQSHFIAIRKKMLKSKEFKEYWKKMPMIHSYNESVAFHETKLTYKFGKLGYKWEAYVETKDMESLTHCPILFYPSQIIEEKKCPIFKRRSFMHNYEDIITNTCGEPGYELMKYLKEKTNYDTNMIWENLLRCYDMDTIKDNLQLNYILPEKSEVTNKDFYKNKKIALVFHAYFEDLIEETAKYVNSMPECADIYITTNTEEKKKIFEKRFKDNKFHKLEVLLIENRGRDVSALLVATKKFIMDYDYVCFAHDKKVSQIKTGSVGKSFGYHCLENILGTSGYVDNIIKTFDENPRLGLLTPMPPIHANYFYTVGNEWTENYNVTKLLADKLELNVPINENHSPIAPLGTMFWFRPIGMKKLFDQDWEYKDFPKEPNRTDGTLLHAVERCYGFVEQDAGYYCAWCYSDKGAAIAITNYNYMLGNINKQLLNIGIAGPYYAVINSVRNIFPAVAHLKQAGLYFERAYPDLFETNNGMKIRLYVDNGKGFNEKNTIIGKHSIKDGKMTCTFTVPKEFDSPKALRIDPGEDGYIILSNIKIKVICKDNQKQKNSEKELKIKKDTSKEYLIENSKLSTNAIVSGRKYAFLCNDPMLIWNSNDFKNIKKITIEADINTNFTKEDVVNSVRKSFKSSSLASRIKQGISRRLKK